MDMYGQHAYVPISSDYSLSHGLGLGIMFEPFSIDDGQTRYYDHYGLPQAPYHDRARGLKHSMSYDALRQSVNRHPAAWLDAPITQHRSTIDSPSAAGMLAYASSLSSAGSPMMTDSTTSNYGDSPLFSPQSMSSLPSSSGENDLVPSVPRLTIQKETPNPALSRSRDGAVSGPYYRQLLSPVTLAAPRVSPYLRTEQRRRKSLSRPKSMLELGDLYALQATKEQAQAAAALTQSHNPSQSPLPQIRRASAFKPSPFLTANASLQPPTASSSSRVSSNDLEPRSLTRSSTLLDTNASPRKKSADLKRLLLPAQQSIKRSALEAFSDLPLFGNVTLASSSAWPDSTVDKAVRKVASTSSPVLENHRSAGKDRVRVELDLCQSVVVEGGMVKGRLRLRLSEKFDGERLRVGRPKIRIVGYEELSNEETREIFYHFAEDVDGFRHGAVDSEGFWTASTARQDLAFAVRLPPGTATKGIWKGKAGTIRYAAIASVRVRVDGEMSASVAHTCQPLEVYPSLPISLLASPLQTIVESTEQHNVKLSMCLQRPVAIAGQQVFVEVAISNGTDKKIKSLTVSLVQTTTWHRVDGTQTTRKRICETLLDTGRKLSRASSSWSGVEPGDTTETCRPLQVPSDALSIPKGTYFEVSYALRTTLSSASSNEVALEVPIRVINFLSISSTVSATETTALDRPVHHSYLKTPAIAPQPTSPPPPPRQPSRHEGALRYFASLDNIASLYERDAPLRAPRALPMPPQSRISPRDLTHQFSLNCIGSAIASATARRNSKQGESAQDSAARSSGDFSREGYPRDHAESARLGKLEPLDALLDRGTLYDDPKTATSDDSDEDVCAMLQQSGLSDEEDSDQEGAMPPPPARTTQVPVRRTSDEPAPETDPTSRFVSPLRRQSAIVKKSSQQSLSSMSSRESLSSVQSSQVASPRRTSIPVSTRVPISPRRPRVLPAVEAKVKVAESRRSALHSLTIRGYGDSSASSQSDTISPSTNSEQSFDRHLLERADSSSSFRAPLFKARPAPPF